MQDNPNMQDLILEAPPKQETYIARRAAKSSPNIKSTFCKSSKVPLNTNEVCMKLKQQTTANN